MKKVKPRSALLLSTYNWPEALELVLKSVLQQKVQTDEIIIADDGSGKETKDIITQFEVQSSVPVRHVWQEDLGFRKSAILNKAVASSDVDYIIQIDGDCILHPYFVKDHLQAAQEGCFLYGSRVNIKKEFLSKLFAEKITIFPYRSEGIKNKTRNIRSPLLGMLYRSRSTFSRKFRGCNTSYFRTDFIKVNGYNEVFEGWGREDSDLAYRLLNSGLKMKRLRYRGILYHIHHEIKSKAQLAANDAIEQLTIQQKIVRIEKGVDQYL